MKHLPNSQKWTLEKVSEHLERIFNDTFNADTLYLGQALANEDLYNDVWRYWKKIFAEKDNVLETMKQIEQRFEAKLYQGALRKTLSPWMAMFGLRINHRWDERLKDDTDNDTIKQDDIVIHMDKDTIMCINTGEREEIYTRVIRPTELTEGAPDDKVTE